MKVTPNRYWHDTVRSSVWWVARHTHLGRMDIKSSIFLKENVAYGHRMLKKMHLQLFVSLQDDHQVYYVLLIPWILLEVSLPIMYSFPHKINDVLYHEDRMCLIKVCT